MEKLSNNEITTFYDRFFFFNLVFGVHSGIHDIRPPLKCSLYRNKQTNIRVYLLMSQK